MTRPQTRPLTDSERSTLALHATFALSFGSFLVPSMGRALLTLLACFLLLGVPLAIARVDFASWPAKDLLVLGVATVFAFWTGIAIRDYRRKCRELAPRQELLRADLAGGVAEVEQYHATHAIRVFGPVSRERCYFVRLVDGRVMFVGYWNPPEDESAAEGPELGGFPAAEFEIARGPRSRIMLGVTGQGGHLAPSQTFTLGRHVIEGGQLPESGTFTDSSWESLARVFGPHS
jgi:hypothetical protein